MLDLDWTKEEDTCFSKKYSDRIHEYLTNNRIILKGDYESYRNKELTGKRVLDIGVCEHNLEHISKPDWKHNKVKELASYSVGIDIDKKHVDILNNRGYDIRLVDATSNEDLGEKFDIVLIGDVLEHVDNPKRLLMFAKRHLTDNGKIIATTPNPFFIYFFLMNFIKGPYRALLEHTCWITPTNAVELARRSGLKLHRYLFFKGSKYKLQTLLKKILPVESINGYFVYEFTLK